MRSIQVDSNGRLRNLLTTEGQDTVEAFASRFAGRVAGLVVHDRAAMQERSADVVDALRHLGGGSADRPHVFLEYAAGLDPHWYVDLAHSLADIERASVCIDVGHVGIQTARRALAAARPDVDLRELTAPAVRLPGEDEIQNWLIARISRRVGLKPSQVDVEAPLASLGLNSLAAVQIASEMEVFLGQPVNPTLVYDYPTVEQLARHLAGVSKAEALTALTPDRWAEPLAVVGIMLLLSGPSMVLAWFKLRRRNLAPLLDANGWAVNTQARISIGFGVTLTHTAVLPAGAERSLRDPYAARKPLWPWLLLVAVALALWWGWRNQWTLPF